MIRNDNYSTIVYKQMKMLHNLDHFAKKSKYKIPPHITSFITT